MELHLSTLSLNVDCQAHPVHLEDPKAADRWHTIMNKADKKNLTIHHRSTVFLPRISRAQVLRHVVLRIRTK